MSLLSEQDRSIVESLKIDPTLKPSFDSLKQCLVWDDERPHGVSSAGYELISDLWIIRGYIHRGVPEGEWGEPGDEYFKKLWDDVRQKPFSWPGFRRLQLDENDQKYLESCLQDPSYGL